LQAFFGHCLREKLRRFNEYEFQPFDLVACIKSVNNPVVVIPLWTVFDEGIVREVERIDGFKRGGFLTDFQLLHISLRGLQEHPSPELVFLPPMGGLCNFFDLLIRRNFSDFIYFLPRLLGWKDGMAG
jgi:hypothetical protein